MNKPEESPPPQHVAIIMDGNRRWARDNGTTLYEAYKQGAAAFDRLLAAALDSGVTWVSAFAFSAANKARPPAEVQDIFHVLTDYTNSYADAYDSGPQHRRMRLEVAGRLDTTPELFQQACRRLAVLPDGTDELRVRVYVAYSGRADIIAAARNATQAGPAELDAESLRLELASSPWPDPQLVIRTGGEKRLSDFMIWEAAHAELAFVERLWPDFRQQDFCAILADFRERNRRFGL